MKRSISLILSQTSDAPTAAAAARDRLERGRDDEQATTAARLH